MGFSVFNRLNKIRELMPALPIKNHVRDICREENPKVVEKLRSTVDHLNTFVWLGIFNPIKGGGGGRLAPPPSSFFALALSFGTLSP